MRIEGTVCPGIEFKAVVFGGLAKEGRCGSFIIEEKIKRRYRRADVDVIRIMENAEWVYGMIIIRERKREISNRSPQVC